MLDKLGFKVRDWESTLDDGCDTVMRLESKILFEVLARRKWKKKVKLHTSSRRRAFIQLLSKYLNYFFPHNVMDSNRFTAWSIVTVGIQKQTTTPAQALVSGLKQILKTSFAMKWTK